MQPLSNVVQYWTRVHECAQVGKVTQCEQIKSGLHRIPSITALN